MSEKNQADAWGEINGGLRGSTLLRGGAVVSITAALLNVGAEVFPHLNDPLVTLAWLLWIAALGLMGAGFMWVGVQPFYTRYGWVIGIFFAINALYLMGVLFAGIRPPVPGVSLSIGRALLLLFFAMVEKKDLRPGPATALILIALLQFLKIGVRLAGYWPELTPLLDAGLDAALVVGTAVVIFLVGGSIRRAENMWAREIASQRHGVFSDFNNPEHDWNRED